MSEPTLLLLVPSAIEGGLKARSAPRHYAPSVDEEAFAVLYVQMSRRIFGFAAQRLDPHRAADAVAETFKTAWEKRSTAPQSEDDRRAWVFGIAKLKIRQEAERVTRKHHDHRFIVDAEESSTASADVAESVVDAAVARWVYSQLNEAERELFDVAFMPGLASDEVAVMLGIKVVALRTRISRLRARIRQLLSHAETDAVEGGVR